MSTRQFAKRLRAEVEANRLRQESIAKQKANLEIERIEQERERKRALKIRGNHCRIVAKACIEAAWHLERSVKVPPSMTDFVEIASKDLGLGLKSIPLVQDGERTLVGRLDSLLHDALANTSSNEVQRALLDLRGKSLSKIPNIEQWKSVFLEWLNENTVRPTNAETRLNELTKLLHPTNDGSLYDRALSHRKCAEADLSKYSLLGADMFDQLYLDELNRRGGSLMVSIEERWAISRRIMNTIGYSGKFSYKEIKSGDLTSELTCIEGLEREILDVKLKHNAELAYRQSRMEKRRQKYLSLCTTMEDLSNHQFSLDYSLQESAEIFSRHHLEIDLRKISKGGLEPWNSVLRWMISAAGKEAILQLSELFQQQAARGKDAVALSLQEDSEETVVKHGRKVVCRLIGIHADELIKVLTSVGLGVSDEHADLAPRVIFVSW